MDIDIGGKRRHEFWVADLGPDCILGLDFLRQHDCVIYARRRQVVIEGGLDDVPQFSTAVTKPLSGRWITSKHTWKSCLVTVQSCSMILIRLRL